MADIATIGILSQRAATQRDLLAEQRQSALNIRILIEQAKSMLSERHQITIGAEPWREHRRPCEATQMRSASRLSPRRSTRSVRGMYPVRRPG
jgi:hypothetical protein